MLLRLSEKEIKKLKYVQKTVRICSQQVYSDWKNVSFGKLDLVAWPATLV
jgi:hypothetical protein